ncbi:YeiH family putative sulfate export transporter [Deinococcus detaillensis]|uniref:YeiH family putative sulfate export transporter n=1 Tax=Deinococcus detaillensis TaxID=2592048 RepID=A0A553V1Q3_9DEIO|nr:YeiH family protein [Deinococcus detaillensis]TSA86403.1 YeiH family putative sulfate export transporter [Deinococcus detaillensis]
MSSAPVPNQPSQVQSKFVQLLPGLLLSGAVAGSALWLDTQGWLSSLGLSSLTLAIVLGILVGNTFYARLAPTAQSGVTFSKGTLLRLGIILYGLRLTIQQILGVGLGGLLADLLMLSSTFFLAFWLGTRWLRLDAQTAILIGAGSSICGAAAVMATEPVVKAQAEKVAVAVATVVIFGTIGIFLYPQMNAWHWWPFSGLHFGVYIGSTVHEVAQVVAAGRAISPQVADAAVTVKLLRVILLAPFLLLLSYFWGRSGPGRTDQRGAQKGSAEKVKLSIPWFAFAFIGVALFNSLHLLPVRLLQNLITLDTLLLSMAMAALGLTTHFGAIRQAGAKPLLLGAVLMVWLVGAGGLVQGFLMSVGL